MFTQYIIESAAENIINLELNVDALGKLLKSISSTGQVTMKLSRRDSVPMLSFNSQFFGKSGGTNAITHDLRVRVMSSSFISQITEPAIPDPDVVILLPPLANLQQISNSFRVLSDKFVLTASGQGDFSIAITTPSVKTTTSFRKLINPTLANAETRPDPSTQVSLKIDAKDWCNLLRIGSIAKSVIACFCKDHALVLYVYVSEEGDDHSCVLTYYIATYQD